MEINPDFLANALSDGHNWAIKWEKPGIFSTREDDPENVSFVCEVLEMWDTLEYSFEKLSKKEKERVTSEKFLRFPGFDGNNENELLGIAQFLVESMNRFERFKKTVVNSHMPTVDTYKRMLNAHRYLKKNRFSNFLTCDQIITVLDEQTHPEMRR